MQTVSATLRQWLDVNKGDLLSVVREAVLESEAAKNKQRQQQIKQSKFLMVAEVPNTSKHRPWRVKTAVAFTDGAKASAFERGAYQFLRGSP